MSDNNKNSDGTGNGQDMMPEMVPGLLAHLPDYVSIIRPDGQIDYVNKTLVGFATADLVGSCAFDWMPDEAAGRARACVSRALETGQMQEVEVQVHSGSQDFWFLVRYMPMQDPDSRLMVVATHITDYHNLVDELEISRRRLRQHMENTPLAAISFDSGFRVTRWNPSAERIFGWTAQEAIGKTAIELMVRPQDAERAMREMAAVIAGHRQDVVVYSNVDKNGREVCTRTFITPVFDSHDRVIGIDTLIEDITEPTRLFEHLQQSRQMLSSHMDNTPLASIIWNAQGVVTEWNRAAELMFGWSREEAIGKSFREVVIPPEQHEHMTAEFAGIAAGESPRNVVSECIRRDGMRLICRSYNTPLINATGDLTGIASLVDDVTEREHLVEELEASRRQLIEQLYNTPLAAIVWDVQFRVREWNRAAEALFGYTREQAMGRTGYDLLLQPAERDAARQTVEQFFRDGAVPSSNIHHAWTRDGRYIMAEYFNTPLRDARGQVIAIASLARDMTPERELQQALQRAKQEAEQMARAKSEFLANMSHEIRTPMHGILGAAELLSREEHSPAVREYVDIIRGSAQGLLAIINDVLDFSKIEAGALRLEQVPFDLGRVLARVRELLLPLAQQKHLDFVFEAGGLPALPLMGDPLRIQQVLVNLVGNALKFTTTGGVYVTAEGERDGTSRMQLRLRVRDTGIGIARDKQAAIFSDFSQADGSITREFGGTGLGLAISMRLAQLMGGDIGVQSEPGQGSEFCLRLCLGIASEEVPHPPPAEVFSPPATYQGRVLMVDDNPVNLTIGARLLEAAGLTVDLATNGEEALEKFAARHYDLVFMDIQMPLMNGLDAARHIRRNSGVPIIAMTANVLESDRDGCMAAGMSDFIAKPFRQADLLAVLDFWL